MQLKTSHKFILIIAGLISFLSAMVAAIYASALVPTNITPTISAPVSLVNHHSIDVERNGHLILILGDTMLADYVAREITVEKRDMFQFMTEELFQYYDLVVTNLETNISPPGTGSPQNKSYTFNAPLESIQQLQNAGVDIVSLANNHTMDYGPTALMKQIELLDEAGIKHFGAGANRNQAFAPRYVEVGDNTLAFLGFNDAENLYSDVGVNSPGSAYLRDGAETLVNDAISTAKSNADIVIVYPHWGTEGSPQADDTQKRWAQLFVDAGADLVVGAHPHVIQENTEIARVPVFYSLGNFIGGGFWEGPKSRGEILQLRIENGEIVEFATTEIKINYQGQPKVVGNVKIK